VGFEEKDGGRKRGNGQVAAVVVVTIRDAVCVKSLHRGGGVRAAHNCGGGNQRGRKLHDDKGEAFGVKSANGKKRKAQTLRKKETS